MERRRFLQTSCCTALGISMGAIMIESCGAIYYATTTMEKGKIIVAKSEFVHVIKEKEISRKFVLIKTNVGFPICLYKQDETTYSASLLKCTHNACELNVGGGIYSCPCHGSEFSTTGKVLEGPADRDLQTFKTEIDDRNIYVYLQ